MSAKFDLRPSAYSSSSGMRQHKSSDFSPALTNAWAKSSRAEKRPERTPPKAITQAPVRVAMSTTLWGLKRAA